MVTIAIPTTGKELAQHFGHCEQFAMVTADPETRNIIETKWLDPPEHQPGLLPPWVARQGATVILAGGMGRRAQMLFEQQGVEVVTGVPAEPVERLVDRYLAGTLVSGDNVCDH